MAQPLGESLSLLLVVAGVVLLIGEALAPGAHLLVLGVAVLVAGLVGLLFPAVATPLVLAGILLGAGAAALYAYRRFDIYGGKGIARTSDSSSLRGQEGQVVERVTPTSGRVRLFDGGFDPVYSARSVDGEIAEGTEVMVVDPGGGSVLTVAALDGDDDIDRELARERTQNRDESGSDAAEDADRTGRESERE